MRKKHNLSDDDCEEMLFLVKQAKAQILSWKAHSVIQDWAMSICHGSNTRATETGLGNEEFLGITVLRSSQ